VLLGDWLVGRFVSHRNCLSVITLRIARS
jgi:hypothetical protein